MLHDLFGADLNMPFHEELGQVAIMPFG